MMKRAILLTFLSLSWATSALAQAPTLPPPPSVDYFVGNWGTVSFNDENDVKKMIAIARGYCNLPYKIVKKSDKTFMMYVAENLKEVEILQQDGKTYIIPVTPEGQTVYGARELTVRDANTFSLKYVEKANHARYGQNVFVRCGGRTR